MYFIFVNVQPEQRSRESEKERRGKRAAQSKVAVAEEVRLE